MGENLILTDVTGGANNGTTVNELERVVGYDNSRRRRSPWIGNRK
jgi:hypothetical protein